MKSRILHYRSKREGSIIAKFAGEERKNLKFFVSSLPEGAALVNENLNIELANREWKEIFSEISQFVNFSPSGGPYPEMLKRAGCDRSRVERLAEKLRGVFEKDKKRASHEKLEEEIAFQFESEVRWYELRADRYNDELILILKSDITDLKKENKELKASKKEMETVLKSIKEGISVFNPDLTIKYANSIMKKWYSDNLPLAGKKCHDAFRNNDNPCSNCPVQRSLESGHVENGVISGTEDSDVDFLETFAYPIKDEETGEITGIVEFARDITERKKIERELKIREQQYRKIFEKVPVGIEIKDSEGKIIDVNDRLCEMTGYEEEELINNSFLEVLVADDCEGKTREDFERILAGRDNEKIIYSRKKSGERYYANVKETRIQLPDGGKGVLTMRSDLTDRLEAEKELREEKEKFQSLAETVPFGLYVYGQTFKYVNPALVEKTGYSSEELLNMNFWEIVSPEHQELVKKRGQSRIRGENLPSSYEFKMRKRDGSEFWVLFSGTRIIYEGEKCGIGTAIDITEQKETQKKLAIKEEHYRKIFETAPVGIMLEDSEGNILEVNDRLCEMTGYSEEELVGSSIFETVVTPELAEVAEVNLKKVLAGEKLEFEGYSRRKNGEKYYMHLHEAEVSLPEGGEGVLSIQLDMTELQKKEERLKFLSYHDRLTGLHNRAFMEEEMERLNSERQHPISLIYCDVNGLKIVNDTYGHDKGDKLLKKVAGALDEVTRHEDLVARWAGDEFVILLPQTDRETAEMVVKRIEKACEEADFDDIPVRLGIGIAIKEQMESSFEEIIKLADERMYRDKMKKSRDTENILLQNMRVSLIEKSAESKKHYLRMTGLALKLGEKINLTDEQLNALSLLVSLHDIGMVTISRDILKKSGNLTDEEWEEVKKHPERGYNIVSPTEEFASVAKNILSHHERWDGKGYPEGLEKKQIPFLSRLIAVIDAYEVMTSGRPYQDSMKREEALQEIEDCAGSQFDPELAGEFLEMMIDMKRRD